MIKFLNFILIIVCVLWLIMCIWNVWVRCSTRNDREVKLYIVSLLQENNPDLEGQKLKEKVNEIYNIVNGK